MMEFITYPNNPDGARNLTAEHPSAFKAYDMVYYWPSFTTVDKSLDLPFAFFSLGKLGGFAGSHFGWAVVKEKALAERLAAFIDQAGSQSVDSRWFGCMTVITALIVVGMSIYGVHATEFRTTGRKLVDANNNEVAAATSEKIVDLSYESLTDEILPNLKRVNVKTTAGDVVIWDVQAAENRKADGVIVLHGPGTRLLTIDDGTPAAAQKAADMWKEAGHTLDGKTSQEIATGSGTSIAPTQGRQLLIHHRGRILSGAFGSTGIVIATVQTALAKQRKCSWWSCWWSRPTPSFNARVWTSESWNGNGHEGIDDYAWPEQQLPGWGTTDGTKNVGIAVSGGGTRSYAAGFGQVRGLYATGLLGQVRYMAGISGGAWLTSNYIYSQTVSDDNTFLSAASDETLPSGLTLAKLGESYTPANLAYGATQDLLLDLINGVISSKFWSSKEPGEAWSNGVASSILAPFGLDTDKFYTLNTDVAKDIANRNDDLSPDDFIVPASERVSTLTRRPYMILGITGSGPVDEAAFGEDSKPPLLDPTKKAFVDIQATPLYTGYPLKREVTVWYGDGTSIKKNDGGLVESFAYGGAAPSKQSFAKYGPGKAVLVQGVPRAADGHSGHPWTLKRAAGASSAWGDNDLYYLETPPNPLDRSCSWWQTYCTVTTGGGLLDTVTGFTKFPVLGPKATNWATGVDKPSSNNIRLSDGDVDGDLLGLLDVIIRRVPASVGFGNFGKVLCSKSKWDPAVDTSPAKLTECIATYLPPLFGYAVHEDKWGHPERSPERLQIFKREHFVPLVKMLQDNMDKGLTAFARMTLTTVANTHSGIPAGRQLDCKFRALLPQETQDEIAKGADGQFANFPNYFTMGQNGIAPQSLLNIFRTHQQLVKGLTSLTHAQVRLMSALTSWAVDQHKTDLVDLFANAA
eukprot:g4170.t1